MILCLPLISTLPCLKIQGFKHKVCSHDKVLSRSATLKTFENPFSWVDVTIFVSGNHLFCVGI